ncbi:ABC transporter type 1, transmembrane domain-containing protein [Lipomyces starkeyi]
MASAKPVVDSAEAPLLAPRDGSTVVPVPSISCTDQYSDLAPPETSFFSAYRYATAKDRWLVAFAVFLAVIEGSIKAIMPILFGVFAQNFISSISNCTVLPEYISPDDFQQQANHDAIYFIYFAIAEFTTAHCSTFIFNDRGEVLAARIRKNYLASIMKQNMAYFENLGSGEITTRISSDTMMIQDGISEKLGYLISFCSTFVC